MFTACRFVSNSVEYFQKYLVLLPVNFFQLIKNKFSQFKTQSVKKIRAVVFFNQSPAFHKIFVNRRQLIQIAYEYHLQTPKRHVSRRAVEPQEFIQAIEQISPHHRDFVDNDGIELL